MLMAMNVRRSNGCGVAGRCAWLAALLVGASSVCAAQPPTRPTPAPAPAPDRAVTDEQVIPPFERGAGEPLAPVSPAIGAGEQGPIDVPLSSLPADFQVPGAQVLAEGTYVPRMVGRVVKVARGEVVFAPDVDQGEQGMAGTPNPLPLMVLLPSVRRDQLSAALGGVWRADGAQPESGGAERYVLGGQVYVYHGRSHLLCSTFSTASSAMPKGTVPTTGADSAAPGRAGVDELIQQLEEASGGQRALTPGARRRDKEDESVAAAMAEGSVVTNRRGRLVRLSDEDGRLAFVVDNDPDSPAMPAMVLVPCQMLEQVEGVVAARGQEVVVRMSGRVLTSANKASLLPVYFRVERRADITPGQ